MVKGNALYLFIFTTVAWSQSTFRMSLGVSGFMVLMPTLCMLLSTRDVLATTVVAARFQDGVVIGADSRTSQGNFVANRLTDKITPIYPGIFLARSGSSADSQFVAGVVEAKLEAYRTEFGRAPTVRVAATISRNLCYNNKDQLSAGVICAGWDPREGGSVFSIPQQDAVTFGMRSKGACGRLASRQIETEFVSITWVVSGRRRVVLPAQGGSLLELPFAISGSGSVYALGYCDDHLRPGLGRDECVLHVQKALEMALSRDGASGGIIRMCVATRAGVERWTVAPGLLQQRREAGRAPGDGGG